MVKGVSKQVIMVKGSDPAAFDQAIFILKDHAVYGGAITDEYLLKEARAFARPVSRGIHTVLAALIGAAVGGCLVGGIWLIWTIL